MRLRQANRTLRRFIGAPLRRVWRRPLWPHVQRVWRHPLWPRVRPEFSRVNQQARSQSVQPELSGLRLHRPRVPTQALRQLIQLGYGWQPSDDYRRRQEEMRALNQALKSKTSSKHDFVPPILLFPDQNDVAPTRPHPVVDRRGHTFLPSHDPPQDLTGLAEAARSQTPLTLQVRLPQTDADYLVDYRHLLPRPYRQFVRHSPYFRLAGALVAVTLAVLGFVWMSQLQQEEAVAAGRLHVARSALHAELVAAQAYGVDATVLRPIERQARRLDRRAAPSGIIINRTRLTFYGSQTRVYRGLLGRLRKLERRAYRYWSWKESAIYASLVRARQQINSLGLPISLPRAPGCRTPTCYREYVMRDSARTAWFLETAGTLRVYGAAIATSSDPAAAAGTELQKAQAIRALLPNWANPPARLAELDGAYATAAQKTAYARIGALAHLDADALQSDLIRVLPPRALAVSLEDQQLTCYQHGRAAYATPVTAGSSTPTGIFHIQVKQPAISTIYWGHTAAVSRDRLGSLPDWMAFSGGAALQAAPWRTVFGPGSDAILPLYAPSTPGSIDLPRAAADRVYRWTAVGTEVVVY